MSKLLGFFVLGVLQFSNVWADCSSMVAFGMPTVKVGAPAGTILCRRMYVLEHNNSRHTAYWSAERIVGLQQEGQQDRDDAFQADPDLPQKASARTIDYLNSGYDKGHLSPVGNMHFDKKAMRESFYLSNIIPQNPTNNRVGWRQLEMYARQIAVRYGEVYVITGPIYKGSKITSIGPSGVLVPTHLFKILYNPVKNETLSFIVPNKPMPSGAAKQHISTVATVERLTNIKFFPAAAKKIKDSKIMW